MEEPPKIDRIISSQGISLSDTASILNAYLSNIEHLQYGGLEATSDTLLLSGKSTTADGGISENAHNKSRQEREEEALIAQMDQLTNTKSSSSSSSSAGRMISDDIYERLKLIAQSICAEVEGKPYTTTTSRMMTDDNVASDNGIDMGDIISDINGATTRGVDEFLAELDEAQHRLEQEEEEQKRQENQLQVSRSSQMMTKKDKKKEKKAKKAAKKAKKEAKRKSLQTL
jgi:hypothetical protein